MKPILDGYPAQQPEQQVSYDHVPAQAAAPQGLGREEMAAVIRDEMVNSQWRDKVLSIDSEGTKKYPDYAQVTGVLGSQMHDPDVKEVIDNAMLHPNAHDILFELGKNPEELARCLELKPAGLKKRFTSLGVKKQAPGVAAPTQKVSYKEIAAPPVSSMPSNDAGVAQKLNADDLTQKLLRGEAI